jgi:hypothetical protein
MPPLLLAMLLLPLLLPLLGLLSAAPSSHLPKKRSGDVRKG